MKTDDIAKGASGRMNAKRASLGGGHAFGVGRIHSAPSIPPRPDWRGSRATGVTSFRKHEETFCEVVKKESGFTLIELMIVISILGIIVSFLMPALNTTVRNARATACLIDRQNIQVATDLYVRMNNFQLDDDMPTITTLVSEGFLPSEDKCPSNGIYVWNNSKYKGIADPFFLFCSIHFAPP